MKLTLKNNKKLYLLFLIPFISIIAVIIYRHVCIPTNEDIVKYVKNAEIYSSKVRYYIKNTKREYKEDTNIYYCRNQGMRIEFEGDRVKIYKDGFIRMNDNGDEYEIDENLDQVYPLSFMSNILSNNIKEIKEGAEEWGDTKYIEVNVELPFKNNHMNLAKLYINKDSKKPIVTKVFDINNKEKMDIIYDDFEYLRKIDNDLF